MLGIAKQVINAAYLDWPQGRLITLRSTFDSCRRNHFKCRIARVCAIHRNWTIAVQIRPPSSSLFSSTKVAAALVLMAQHLASIKKVPVQIWRAAPGKIESSQ